MNVKPFGGARGRDEGRQPVHAVGDLVDSRFHAVPFLEIWVRHRGARGALEPHALQPLHRHDGAHDGSLGVPLEAEHVAIRDARGRRPHEEHVRRDRLPWRTRARRPRRARTRRSAPGRARAPGAGWRSPRSRSIRRRPRAPRRVYHGASHRRSAMSWPPRSSRQVTPPSQARARSGARRARSPGSRPRRGTRRRPRRRARPGRPGSPPAERRPRPRPPPIRPSRRRRSSPRPLSAARGVSRRCRAPPRLGGGMRSGEVAADRLLHDRRRQRRRARVFPVREDHHPDVALGDIGDVGLVAGLAPAMAEHGQPAIAPHRQAEPVVDRRAVPQPRPARPWRRSPRPRRPRPSGGPGPSA